MDTQRVIVAGSINMDVVVSADKHPQIGETVFGSRVEFLPGGKGANQAVACARLGAPTLLIGTLGNDRFGDELHNFLSQQGIDLSLIKRVDTVTTGTALITVANADNTIVVVPGANAKISPEDIVGVEISQGDILVSQFEIPEEAIESFFSLGKEKGATTILNPAPAKKFSASLLNLVDILILNETELSFLTGAKGDGIDAALLVASARTLLSHNGQIIILTLGALGAIAVLQESEIRVSGNQVDAIDTTGAGDCFIGAFASRLAKRESLETALNYANCAASLSVQRMGASPSMPTESEVDIAAHK